MAKTYLPQNVFATADGKTPRVMIAPQRYIQGDGVLDHLGKYLSLVHTKRSGVLVSRRGLQADGARVLQSMKSAAIEAVISTFNGESSLEEIDMHVRSLAAESIDCLIAVGGGKCVDTGKSVAYRLGVPVVIVPTLASNDAPCSALSVLYRPDGVFVGAEFFPDSPAMVVVDTGVVANAGARYLVSGMGDAMATWYEARVCINNPRARTTIGARPTLAACAMGEICAQTLFEAGVAAASSVTRHQVDDALEKVVEANTLLSGIGFESGGLAAAHGIAQSYTAIKIVHDNYLHGEMVAMGTLAQLMMESPAEARRVAEFFAAVGLPIHLGQISLNANSKVEIDTVVEAAMASPIVHNMPIEVTPDLIRSSMLDADKLGLAVAAEKGDSAYRALHG